MALPATRTLISNQLISGYRMTPTRFFYAILILAGTFSLIMAGCGRVRTDETMSQEDLWELANTHFRNENYLNTIDLLTTFTLNYSGSTIIDSAQFLLGESHFALEEYILAESEYNRLIQNMPRSLLGPEARLKMVLCNVYLSPGFGLDQKFTERAINSAQNFKEDYPSTDVTVRLARRTSGWGSLGRIFTLGLWKPKVKEVEDTPIFNTKVVYPHYSTGFGYWLLKVFTIGVYQPPELRLVIPSYREVDGDWLVTRALLDSRSRLAKKDYRAGELYYRQKNG